MQKYKFHYVYRIEKIDTHEFYIGLRSTNDNPEDDPYLGSGIRIENSVKKHGREKFRKTILGTYNTRREASLAEAEFITVDILLDPLCLNLKTGGEYITGVSYDPEVGKKISEALKLKYSDPEERIKHSERLKKSYKENPEFAKAISEMRKRVLLDPKHRERALRAVRKSYAETDRAEKVKSSLNRPETKTKKSESMKAYCNSDRGKIHMSRATSNTTYMNLNGITKRIKNELVETYAKMGWHVGSCIEVSLDTKNKLGNVTRGRKWMYNPNTNERKRILPSECDAMINDGWNYGQGPKSSNKR